MGFLGDFELGDAAEGKAVRLIVGILKANASGVEVQVP